jgi:WhiB family redox-sensing transcriptional regulator
MVGNCNLWDFVEPNSIWKLSGSCSRTGQPDLWYSTNRQEQRAAQKICYRCPVLSECLIYAFQKDEQFGIWGGMTEQERRNVRKK